MMHDKISTIDRLIDTKTRIANDSVHSLYQSLCDHVSVAMTDVIDARVCDAVSVKMADVNVICKCNTDLNHDKYVQAKDKREIQDRSELVKEDKHPYKQHNNLTVHVHSENLMPIIKAPTFGIDTPQSELNDGETVKQKADDKHKVNETDNNEDVSAKSDLNDGDVKANDKLSIQAAKVDVEEVKGTNKKSTENCQESVEPDTKPKIFQDIDGNTTPIDSINTPKVELKIAEQIQIRQETPKMPPKTVTVKPKARDSKADGLQSQSTTKDDGLHHSNPIDNPWLEASIPEFNPSQAFMDGPDANMNSRGDASDFFNFESDFAHKKEGDGLPKEILHQISDQKVVIEEVQKVQIKEEFHFSNTFKKKEQKVVVAADFGNGFFQKNKTSKIEKNQIQENQGHFESGVDNVAKQIKEPKKVEKYEDFWDFDSKDEVSEIKPDKKVPEVTDHPIVIRETVPQKTEESSILKNHSQSIPTNPVFEKIVLKKTVETISIETNPKLEILPQNVQVTKSQATEYTKEQSIPQITIFSPEKSTIHEQNTMNSKTVTQTSTLNQDFDFFSDFGTNQQSTNNTPQETIDFFGEASTSKPYKTSNPELSIVAEASLDESRIAKAQEQSHLYPTHAFPENPTDISHRHAADGMPAFNDFDSVSMSMSHIDHRPQADHRQWPDGGSPRLSPEHLILEDLNQAGMVKHGGPQVEYGIGFEEDAGDRAVFDEMDGKSRDLSVEQTLGVSSQSKQEHKIPAIDASMDGLPFGIIPNIPNEMSLGKLESLEKVSNSIELISEGLGMSPGTPVLTTEITDIAYDLSISQQSLGGFPAMDELQGLPKSSKAPLEQPKIQEEPRYVPDHQHMNFVIDNNPIELVTDERINVNVVQAVIQDEHIIHPKPEKSPETAQILNPPQPTDTKEHTNNASFQNFHTPLSLSESSTPLPNPTVKDTTGPKTKTENPQKPKPSADDALDLFF